MRSKKAVLAVATVLALFGASAVAAVQAIDGTWRPTQIGALSVPADTAAFVTFADEGGLSGHGGCNRFFGTYEVRGDSLEIGPLGATRMACPGPETELETHFLRALGEARHFSRQGNDLLLTNEAGDELLRLVDADAK